MNTEQDELVISLKEKIFKLILFINDLKNQNKVLLKNNLELENALSELMKSKNDINEKYEHLKLGKIIDVSGNEFDNARKKISRIVREVDNCIALLNK